MRPAAEVVVRTIRAGLTPSVLQFGAMLFEAGCDQAEARSLTASYADAIAGCASAETVLMAELRGFTLGRG